MMMMIVQNDTYHDLKDLSGGRSEWTLILLWNGDVCLLNLPQKISCPQKNADSLFHGNYSWSVRASRLNPWGTISTKHNQPWVASWWCIIQVCVYMLMANTHMNNPRCSLTYLPRILSISSHLLISLTKRRWNELTLGLSWNQRSITGQVSGELLHQSGHVV